MTSIEWCDETWNPVVGCSRVSAGCDNCYAMGVAHRQMQPAHVGLTKLRGKDAKRPGVDWNGTMRCLPERLEQPLRWRKPRRVFVNSMSDLFHEAVPFEFTAAVFGVMAAVHRHTFILLTKRPERAREFFTWIATEAYGRAKPGSLAATEKWAHHESIRYDIDQQARAHVERLRDLRWAGGVWPLQNVILGVSVEDQETADERIPILLDTPAAVRCVSYEPALGPVDLRNWLDREPYRCGGCVWESPDHEADCPGHVDVALDWVIVGGESGPGARDFDIEWARTTVESCEAAGVPVFVKQLGARPVFESADFRLVLPDRKGKDPSEWPENLRVRQFPEVPR